MNMRVLTATNAKLVERIVAGAFRQDLYFRLARFPVEASPLRERKEDIEGLAEHFVILPAAEMGTEPSGISAEALSVLADYDFPGNVRELKNIIEKALIKN